MAVEIYKKIFGSRNTEDLIKSTCFYLKFSRVHLFFFDFSRVYMFCNYDRPTVAPGSTRSGVY